MNILIGTLFLVIILVLFTLFTYKAPKGMKAMGALANAAIATFLVEAFHKYVGGDLLGIKFLGDLGDATGNLGGVAAAGLVALAVGVSPVYAFVIATACGGMDLIPGFISGYLIGLLMVYIEKKAPDGIDLIVGILIIAPLSRLIAVATTPLIDNSLLKIGSVIQDSTQINPIIMGLILGAIITLVNTTPLSSMALTALLGLTGVPMAIGAMGSFSSAFINGVMFNKLKLGNRRDRIAVCIEPLSQADLISANPVPIYTANIIGGGLSGIVIALSGMVNDATGTATPLAGILVMFGFNDFKEVLIYALIIGIIGTLAGYICSILFKNYPIVTKEQVKNK